MTLEENRVAIMAAMYKAENVLKNTWNLWDYNETAYLGQDYFSSIISLARICDPELIITIGIVKNHGSGIINDPCHIVVRTRFRRLHLSIISSALSGSPHFRAVGARIIGCMLIFSRLCSDPQSMGGEFVLGLQDHDYGASVAFCSSGESLLIPDPEYLMSFGYSDFKKAVDENWTPWDSRQKRVFWRGSTTGVQRPVTRYQGEFWPCILPRTEACARLQRSDLASFCDVGISAIVQLTNTILIEKIQRELSRNRVERINQVGFQFQLDIDGNTNAWAGLFQALLMGSCVIKIESEYGFKQWYYDRLVPGYHYVSVASDLSDLEEKVDWALSHENECRAIAEAGFALSREMTVDREVDRCVGAIYTRFLQ